MIPRYMRLYCHWINSLTQTQKVNIMSKQDKQVNIEQVAVIPAAPKVKVMDISKMSPEQILAYLRAQNPGMNVAETEKQVIAHEEQERKTAINAAIQASKVIVDGVKHYKTLTLTLTGDEVTVQYGAIAKTVPESGKGSRVFKTHLIVKKSDGTEDYRIKANFNKDFVRELTNNIPECKGKPGSWIREYFKQNKDECCHQLNAANPAKFIIPA